MVYAYCRELISGNYDSSLNGQYLKATIPDSCAARSRGLAARYVGSRHQSFALNPISIVGGH